MKKLFIVGIGPGGSGCFTKRMIECLEESEAVVGYTPYLEYIEMYLDGKKRYSTGMTSEIERCKKAIALAKEGVTTAIVSTGDAGLYGMAGPILELARDEAIEIEVVPGVSSNFAAASRVGAPIMHDMATISLSDLMTPFDLIMKRVRLAARGDFVLCFYNPRSKGRRDYLEKAFQILMEEGYEDSRPVAVVKDALRAGERVRLATIGSVDFSEIDMKTMVIVGNAKSYLSGEWMITPRGYDL
ncbi:MAG: precorrin-3B C(17)-methyltransferase [Peptoniphilus sp.]|nr:precorrin-3B C(17)-methyltransferase [Peptoniphilus sp.]MDD7363722.1 precorrin-3B C(17)-methyltransferase [Bacillota bacterium]MDY6044107.1 precorrin-3B C(17)-methyltransferase [Peptoniphilus sp.]